MIKKLENKISNNKPLMITYGIFKGIVTVILLLFLIVILVQKFSNNNIAIKGIRIFSVASESMAPTYEIGDILITKKTNKEEIKVGDDVTYYGEKGDMKDLVVTHRVVSVRKDKDTYYYITKGTANEVADPEISYSQIYGKVIYKTVVLSYISKIMLNTVAYFVLFTIIGLIASYQVVRIVFDKDDEEIDDKGQEEE